MPEPLENVTDIAEVVEPEEAPVKPQMSKAEAETRRKKWTEFLEDEIDILRKHVEVGMYAAAKRNLLEMEKYIDELSQLPEEDEE